MLSYNYKQIIVSIIWEITIQERNRDKTNYNMICEVLEEVQGAIEMHGS